MKNIKLLNKKYVCEKTKMLAFKSEISQTLKFIVFAILKLLFFRILVIKNANYRFTTSINELLSNKFVGVWWAVTLIGVGNWWRYFRPVKPVLGRSLLHKTLPL